MRSFRPPRRAAIPARTAAARSSAARSSAGRTARARAVRARTALAVLAAVLAVGACLPGADADAAVAPPGAELVLAIHHGRYPAAPLTAAATLGCRPPGGSHPHPRAACAALQAAHGDFGRLRPVPGDMCPMVFDPVTVTATGMWLGRPIGYAHTFPNRCVAEQQTAGVFAF